jgi:hypothetical protein
MKLRLEVHVNREDKQVVVSILCNHCPHQAAGTVSGDMVTFRCPTHGKLGSANLAEVTDILDRARSEAESREGWDPSGPSTIVAHRDDEKPN